jgi:ABC-2 type transport system permease protein
MNPGEMSATTTLWLPAYSLWWREVKRFYRQRARVAGVILSPLLFWLLMGAGFGNSLNVNPGAAGPATSQSYLEYFFPGALVMIVLFTSIFTMMSVIEDRKEGFLLAVMVAPISRAAIVLGKVLGGATLATLQGLMFLLLAPFIGIRFGADEFAVMALAVFLIAFALTALGFAVAWSMDSNQAFHAVVNLFLLPLWLLSGALFPVSGAHGWMRAVMKVNPLTYGVAALRAELFPAMPQDLGVTASVAILAAFCAGLFLVAFAVVNRRAAKGRPAA